MRGVPNNPVVCRICGEGNAAPKDRRCRECRFRSMNPRKRYFFTAEHNQRLRELYAAQSHNRWKLSEGLTAFVRLTGIPREIVKQQAGRLGITADHRRPWTESEREQLAEMAGSKTAKQIAATLGRAHNSVVAMMDRLKISRCVTEGYTREQAAHVIGVSTASIDRWLRAGWLKFMAGTQRISESSITAFLHKHSEHYSLKRVDEVWFKGIVFPTFGIGADLTGKRVASADDADEAGELELRA